MLGYDGASRVTGLVIDGYVGASRVTGRVIDGYGVWRCLPWSMLLCSVSVKRSSYRDSACYLEVSTRPFLVVWNDGS